MLFVFDDIGSLLPIIMMVAVWTIILNNNSKRRRKRHDEPADYENYENSDAENLPQESRKEERENAPQPMETEEHKPRSGRDLAAEFERKLRAKSAKADAKNDGVVTDSEVAVHREQKPVNKQPVAQEKARPVGTDYSKWGGAGMQTAYASAMQDKNFCTVPEAHEVHFDDNASKRRFARPALVQGFIMSQVLDKPAALKPYDDHLSSL